MGGGEEGQRECSMAFGNYFKETISGGSNTYAKWFDREPSQPIVTSW